MSRQDDHVNRDAITAGLEAARAVLPDQGPIGVFIHHNTLHAFQHLPFHEAVRLGAALTGARPYLDEGEYRDAWLTGRIAPVDLDEALNRSVEHCDERPVALGRDRRGLRRLLLLHDPLVTDLQGERFRARAAGLQDDERLLDTCVEVCRRGPVPMRETRPITRHRDALVGLGAEDTDASVQREVIRLSAGYLDQGQALLSMPDRSGGFLHAVSAMYSASGSSPLSGPGAAAAFADVVRSHGGAHQVIREVLDSLGVEAGETQEYLTRTALALPGWAGMFSRLELHPEEGDPRAPASLAEFVAVWLVIERAVLGDTTRRHKLPLRLSELREAVGPACPSSAEEAGCRLFHLAKGAGLALPQVQALPQAELAQLWEEASAFPSLVRRGVWHEAYEGWYRRSILDAVAARAVEGPRPRPEQSAAQFVFCIDEREESIRRAIEEQGADLETFGAAGFFGVAIDYRGLYDPEPAAHCPVVVTPDHEVHELPIYTSKGWHDARQRMRDAWTLVHRVAHRRSRSLGGGAVLSFLFGPFAATLALTRVLFPRLSLGTFKRLQDRVVPRPTTRLATLRPTDEDERSERGKWRGFALSEAVDRVANTLRAIGLVDGFAPVVILLGHGSTSLNNPHESAHDCGACGGRRGGANARLFADLANRPEIRAALRERGITIPDGTWFIGALHDTADDAVHYYDLELLPEAQAQAFELADHVLQVARQASAQERCRRFHHAPLGISPEDALRHVESRSAHLAQPRPEYGHCTNAICVVGRRELTRGLHFDRRAFLVSYDPTRDREHAVLERTLAAVGPVGAGISLEYYFSSVDNEVYGCGTKLPHNVTGFIGVMNGHESDLRTGLPLQMVELHEPMRLLLIVEATPEALLHVAGRQPEVRELVVNEWVQLVSLHPETGVMVRFSNGTFVPYTPLPGCPVVRTSVEWHGRSRTHLTPALVTNALSSHLVQHTEAAV